MSENATAILTDIVLLDVVNFSKLDDSAQLVAATRINHGIRTFLDILPSQSLLQHDEVVLSVIPTGDGFYVIMHQELAGYGPLFALSLRNHFLATMTPDSPLAGGIKVAAHLGTALPFIDATRRVNYVGHGLNDCERIMRDRRVRERARQFAGDENYVIASRSSWERFHECFPTDEFGDFFRVIGFRNSEEIEFADAHGRTHAARAIEISRLVSVPPPRPVDAKARQDRTRAAATGSESVER